VARTRAVELCLVNWKGVFCESYRLDRHVTALEGANGAGKTTVMIAAYLVLFPDLTRLRFTNLGESAGASGDKGIWGRLGEIGRPSYSALRLQRGDGSEVLIGVHALRKTEPSLELTPFMLTELRPELSTQELLLLSTEDHEEVPTLREVGENAGRRGVHFATFPTLKDYFSMLFELGISPLRLASDEEKGKYNDMLRTSMTGGISRALTNELRSFLLKEENGLSGTLGRMRSNLDACRRTRAEVSQARVLENEISGIYSAGHGMFSRAVLATEKEIRESFEKVERVRREREQEAARVATLEVALSEARVRHAGLVVRLKEQRGSSEQQREQLRRLERARLLAARLDDLERELQRLTAAADTAEVSQQVASNSRQHWKDERSHAQAALARSAQGLANLQQGLEELHRRAHAFRSAEEALAKCRALSGNSAFAPSQIAEAKDSALQRCAELDQERATKDREMENAKRREAEHDAALTALGALCSSAGQAGVDLYALAQQELAVCEAEERLSQRLDELLHEEQRKTAELRQKELLNARLKDVDPEFPLDPSALSGVLRSLDEQLLGLEQTAREAELRAEEAGRVVDTTARSLKQLEELVARYAQVALALKRADSVVGTLPAHSESVATQLKSLRVEVRRIRRELERLLAERERALFDASLVGQAGGGDVELLRLRDVIDGELLAERFEDLDVDAACKTQAQLGPLANALVVMDPEEALTKLASENRELATVWLVKAGANLGELVSRDIPGQSGGDVVVETEFGLRVTRIEATGTLSRRARERRAELAAAEALELGTQIERLELWLPRAEDALSALEFLEKEIDLWRRGDPSVLELEARAALLTAEEQKDLRRRELIQIAEKLRTFQLKANGVRPLLAEAWLLENAAEPADVLTARNRVARAREARLKITESGPAVAKLRQHLHSLASPPASPDELKNWEAERPQWERERDTLFALLEALSQLAQSKHALSWRDAPRSLEDDSALVPELEAQHENSRLGLAEVERQFGEAESVWERLTEDSQKATAEKLAVAAHKKRAADELTLEQVEDLSEQALRAAVGAEEQRKRTLESAELEERALLKEVALREEHLKQATRALTLSEAAEKKETDGRAPAEAAGARLREALGNAQILGNTLAAGETSELSEVSSVTLWAEAKSKRELLLERMKAARGGQELAESMSLLDRSSKDAPWEQFLKDWLSVRQWLRRRLPPQVSDVEEPLEALSHLGADLGRLESRLERQETDLRGTSEDVARSIEVQLRKASGQVRRLNQYLEGVHFGSIAAIRVELGRVERMDQVLSALRSGTAQELLFQSDLPIEEAMDEIFRRYGGGRTGGQKLLDYREYVDLRVEVRRQTKETWEPANPTQVSTGEAIGVGAALMMVILTEWERDANLLRSRRTEGCLRFLFLDEANRLSQDNLSILFDLCANLDLQLLIAAPEVAHSEKNTTYRLVRRVSDEGKEEVLVSGRRASLPEWPPAVEEPETEVLVSGEANGDGEPSSESSASEEAVLPLASEAESVPPSGIPGQRRLFDF